MAHHTPVSGSSVDEDSSTMNENTNTANIVQEHEQHPSKEADLVFKIKKKLLTAKQKEKARRLEAMRNQILANAGGLPVSAPTKRPKYQSKKSKPHANVKDPSTSASQVIEEKPDDVDMEVQSAEENVNKEVDDDDEWDAKSWDVTDLKQPGVPQPHPKPELLPTQVKKEIKNGNNSVAFQKHESKETKPSIDKGKGKMEDSEKTLRSSICCIMGHVDTGKTKLLDCIRRTNVEEGEAGGITHQIGATYIPAENIRERSKELKADAILNVPGLLVIDTSGHESFKNLILCDIAILVVDIMHGLEPQTIESLNLLRMRNTEFIVALNKVDRLYGWKTCRNAPIKKVMKLQTRDVRDEFNRRVTQIISQFMEQGLKTELYYKNRDRGETMSLFPTSAISGEGIPEMLLLLVQWAQKTMVEQLT